MIKEGNLNLIERLINDDLFFPVFLMIFFKELRADLKILIKVLALDLFIYFSDKFGLERYKGSARLSAVNVLLKLHIILGYGVEILLEFCVGEREELFTVGGYVICSLLEKGLLFVLVVWCWLRHRNRG